MRASRVYCYGIRAVDSRVEVRRFWRQADWRVASCAGWVRLRDKRGPAADACRRMRQNINGPDTIRLDAAKSQQDFPQASKINPSPANT